MKRPIMKSTIFNYFLLLIALAITSCVSPKKVVYFQDSEGVQINETIVNFEPKIQIGDILSINVSAINPEATIPFNLYENPKGNNPKILTYLVDVDGKINFPVIGKIKVEGYTTKEITNLLSEKIAVYITNPIVNVRLTNFKITVLGEVKSPGTYQIPNERISVIEAIGLAGDLTIQGKRSKVSLIREVQGKRIFQNIDLTSKELFNSPYFYLAQNDVLYIEPNKTKINSSAVGANTGVIFSSISILISLITLLTR